jgi:hypothetical protein
MAGGMGEQGHHDNDGPAGWLGRFRPSPRVENAVAILMLIVMVVAILFGFWYCYQKFLRWRSASMKRRQVRPVDVAIYTAANPAPAPAQVWGRIAAGVYTVAAWHIYTLSMCTSTRGGLSACMAVYIHCLCKTEWMTLLSLDSWYLYDSC